MRVLGGRLSLLWQDPNRQLIPLRTHHLVVLVALADRLDLPVEAVGAPREELCPTVAHRHW
jgi:hypothetical protein